MVCTDLNAHHKCNQHTKVFFAGSKVNKRSSKIQHKIKQTNKNAQMKCDYVPGKWKSWDHPGSKCPD